MAGMGLLQTRSNHGKYQVADEDEVDSERAAFRYYKFSTLKLRQMKPNCKRTYHCVQIGDITFYKDGQKVSFAGATASVISGHSPGRERPKNVLDGNARTKWLDFGHNGKNLPAGKLPGRPIV